MDESCYVEPKQKVVSEAELDEAQMATLTVWGMGCANCATRVRNSLLALDGVVSAHIDLQRGLAYVDYLPAKTELHALVLAIAAAGNDGLHDYRAEILP